MVNSRNPDVSAAVLLAVHGINIVEVLAPAGLATVGLKESKFANVSS